MHGIAFVSEIIGLLKFVIYYFDHLGFLFSINEEIPSNPSGLSIHSANPFAANSIISSFDIYLVAKTISSKSNLTIKIGKQAFYKQLEMPLKKAYDFTAKMMTLNMMSIDAKEGIQAFIEKRKPKWKNR